MQFIRHIKYKGLQNIGLDLFISYYQLLYLRTRSLVVSDLHLEIKVLSSGPVTSYMQAMSSLHWYSGLCGSVEVCMKQVEVAEMSLK